MNTPADGLIRFKSDLENIQIKRMTVNEIIITQDVPSVLYQIPFELTIAPNRCWKEVLIDTWHSLIQQKEPFSNTVIWVFNNRILVNKVPSQLVNKQLETLITNAVSITNELMKLSSKRAI
tara:strand:- start:1037 stop:1399 length:363 start_codon:yes stop_codon:yes gene_type:complete